MKTFEPKHFFFCPASDYLNQYNETGSHGQISYQFMKHLAEKPQVESLFAPVIMSLKVDPIPKTTILPLIEKSPEKAKLTAFDSLYFYIVSFFKFFGSKAYKEADVVHHIIPFAMERSFNLFFIFKDPKKKYVIGPIIGPHISTAITADEEYVFKEEKNLITRFSDSFQLFVKQTLETVFGSVLSYLSKLTVKNADIVLFSDNHALNYHKKFLHANQQGLILDTGIDVKVFKPLSSNTSTNDDRLKVLFVGRLTKRKGCEYLIQAIAKAVEIKPNIKLRCQILGVGPLREELEELAKKLGIINYIEFLGGVKSNEDIVYNYNNNDIICLPALSETFTVTKEALSSGKPVIVTRVCSNAERIDEGINGFVVPPKDPEAIAKVLVAIADKPEKLQLLSQNALKARELYDWKNITQRYLELLQNNTRTIEK
jgi:glycosyltransferase involved in cell wall biosynthesis